MIVNPSEENPMKRLLPLAFSGALAATCFAVSTFAQGGARGASKLTLHGTTVSVEYGRPALKGRTFNDLLSRLGPGGVWRLGADKSTTFKTTGDVTFGDVKVPAGEYSLWAKKEGDDKWSLVFNKQHGQWGEGTPPEAGHDPSQDLASAPLNVQNVSSSAEQVTITLRKAGPGGEILIHWGTMELSAKFTAG
jgi:Protein of unknown function (DUF2911)